MAAVHSRWSAFCDGAHGIHTSVLCQVCSSQLCAMFANACSENAYKYRIYKVWKWRKPGQVERTTEENGLDSNERAGEEYQLVTRPGTPIPQHGCITHTWFRPPGIETSSGSSDRQHSVSSPHATHDVDRAPSDGDAVSLTRSLAPLTSGTLRQLEDTANVQSQKVHDSGKRPLSSDVSSNASTVKRSRRQGSLISDVSSNTSTTKGSKIQRLSMSDVSSNASTIKPGKRHNNSLRTDSANGNSISQACQSNLRRPLMTFSRCSRCQDGIVTHWNASCHILTGLAFADRDTREDLVFTYTSALMDSTGPAVVKRVAADRKGRLGRSHASFLEVKDPSWQELERLRDAARIFASCYMFTPAFKIHRYIWERLQGTNDCPWGSPGQARTVQVIACARTADTAIDLVVAQAMLEKHIQESNRGGQTKESIFLNMLLADLCMKKTDIDAAALHRGIASIHLPPASTWAAIRSSKSAIPDLVAEYHLLRAYAFKYFAIEPQPILDPSTLASEHGYNLQKNVKQVWSSIAERHYSGLRQLMLWSRCQIASGQDHEIQTIGTWLNAESALSSKYKVSNIAAIFGFLLGRLSDPAVSVDPERRCRLPDLSEDMIGTSSTDILWIVSTAIINAMQLGASLVASPAMFLKQVLGAADRLSSLDCQALLDSIFHALAEGSSLHSSGTNRRAFEPRQPSFSSPTISRLAEGKVQQTLGVVLNDETPIHLAMPIAAVRQAASGSPIASFVVPKLNETALTPRSSITNGHAASLRSFTSVSTRPSYRSFKNFAIRIRPHKAHMSATSLPHKSLRQPESDIVHRGDQSVRHGAFDSISDLMEGLSVSPRSSLRVSFDASNSVRHSIQSHDSTMLNGKLVIAMHNLVEQVFVDKHADPETLVSVDSARIAEIKEEVPIGVQA